MGLLAIALGLLRFCGGARANDMLLLGVGFSHTAAAPAYTGPGDIVASATAWWGLRAYSAAKAAATVAAVNLRRSSDSHTCDIKVTTAGDLGTVTSGCSTGGDNGSTASTWCAVSAGSCFVTKMYDQTAGAACGGSCDVLQATTANQPAFVFSCLGSHPCIQSSTGTTLLQSAANFTPNASATVTLSVVANRAVGTGNPPYVEENAVNRIQGRNTVANSWQLAATSGNLFGVANDAAWHAANALLEGASSAFNVDGTETTVTMTNSTAAGRMIFPGGLTSNTVDLTEGGVWDNIAFSSGNRTSMCHNQFTYWGTATSC